jgi:hypothetical protein
MAFGCPFFLLFVAADLSSNSVFGFFLTAETADFADLTLIIT